MNKLLEEEFWSKVDKSGSCWVWRGPLYGKSYGRFKTTYAHRFSYLINIGNILNGLCVLHRCDNPCCVNPDHLFLGTYRDNTLDKVSKGRSNSPRGTYHYNCKLTDDEITQIRNKHFQGMSAEHLSKIYPVGRRHINKICRGETRKYGATCGNSIFNGGNIREA